jgi:hypothetical protein
VLVDVADHRGERRSSSAPKKVAALLSILVGPAQLAVLALQALDPIALLVRQPAALAGVDLGLTDPVAERLGADASCLATLPTAPWRSPCSAAVSKTSRTALSLNSGGYRRWASPRREGCCCAMTPSSSKR